jgi:uncharacterized protein (DUF433 family)
MQPLRQLASQLTLITVLGNPCITGTRISVVDILDNLADGATEADIIESFPELASVDIRAALSYAAQMVDRSVIITV